MNAGFLGTQAPLAADVVLLLEIAMGIGLLAGAWFARVGRFRLHAWCQSAIVTTNDKTNSRSSRVLGWYYLPGSETCRSESFLYSIDNKCFSGFWGLGLDVRITENEGLVLQPSYPVEWLD
jgi:hypothetical protein